MGCRATFDRYDTNLNRYIEYEYIYICIYCYRFYPYRFSVIFQTGQRQRRVICTRCRDSSRSGLCVVVRIPAPTARANHECRCRRLRRRLSSRSANLTVDGYRFRISIIITTGPVVGNRSKIVPTTTARDNDNCVFCRIISPRFRPYCPDTVAEVLLSRATVTVCRDPWTGYVRVLPRSVNLVGHFLRRRVNYRRTSHPRTFATFSSSFMYIRAFTCSYHYDL